jgi:hypothetical protein
MLVENLRDPQLSTVSGRNTLPGSGNNELWSVYFPGFLSRCSSSPDSSLRILAYKLLGRATLKCFDLLGSQSLSLFIERVHLETPPMRCLLISIIWNIFLHFPLESESQLRFISPVETEHLGPPFAILESLQSADYDMHATAVTGAMQVLVHSCLPAPWLIELVCPLATSLPPSLSLPPYLPTFTLYFYFYVSL